MPRRQGRRVLDHGPRQRVEVLRVADHHVAPGNAAADVEPEVPGCRHLEGEGLVFRIPLADEDLEAVDDRGPIRPPLAAHTFSSTAPCVPRRAAAVEKALAPA
jgi:hypothetical protein